MQNQNQNQNNGEHQPNVFPMQRRNQEDFLPFDEAHLLLCNSFGGNLNDLNYMSNLRNNHRGVPNHILDVIYLQATIMLMGSDQVREYLACYYNIHGARATQLMINFPYFDNDSGEGITALMCACLWTNRVDTIRTLFEFGADVSMMDQDGLFADEHYYLDYFNHLESFICLNDNDPPFQGPRVRRIAADFIDVRDEIERLAGERLPHDNWDIPILYGEIN